MDPITKTEALAELQCLAIDIIDCMEKGGNQHSEHFVKRAFALKKRCDKSGIHLPPLPIINEIPSIAEAQKHPN